MAQALRLGRRTLGVTGENPAVGCVIVKGGVLLGVGWTAAGGRPHAEPQALAMAGSAARGATAYVTLEPCAHHGKTPPCADALVGAGVERVVACLEDPDPRVGGRGFARLRAAGIEVSTGVLEAEARRDLAGFLSRNLRGRPWLALKLAISADHKIAERAGAPTAITGARVRDRVHLMRARADAVLVGVGTAIADDPLLTVRLPGLEERSPVRVVADSRLRLPLEGRLARTAGSVPVWVLGLPGWPEQARRLSELGVEVIECEATPAGQIDLADALRRLAGRGINCVLSEGGAHVARSLVEGGLADEIRLFTALKVIGPSGLDALAGLSVEDLAARHGFAVAGTEAIGDDRLEVLRRKSG